MVCTIRLNCVVKQTIHIPKIPFVGNPFHLFAEGY